MSDLIYLILPDTVFTVQLPPFLQISSPQTDSTQSGAKYPRRHLKVNSIDLKGGQLTNKLILYASHLFLGLRIRTREVIPKRI